MSSRPFSIYLHIPFCLQKCPYCDFNTYALTRIPEKEYVSALRAELDFRASLPEWQGRLVRTIYFGGGTPSLLSITSVRRILLEIMGLFPMAVDLEVSLEANPGTVDYEKLHGYYDAGVNRLSLGAQSMDRDVLKTLGRHHSPDEVEAAVLAARASNIRNVNIDLMYGVPHQTREMLHQDLRAVTALAPSHISAYGLTIEKGTPFFQAHQRGVLPLPHEDVLAGMMEEINAFLPAAGFEHYEISNFAEPGSRARHNLAYWDGEDYLGIGAGAHSYIGERENERIFSGRRWSNFALPNKYIEHATAHGSAEGWSDSLSLSGLMFEFFFLGLRKVEGVELGEFEARFGVPASAAYPTVIPALKSRGMLREKEGRLRLTPAGLLLADSVIESFSEPETFENHMSQAANA